MSNAVLKGNASGTGTVTLETPNTNTDRTITIPDASGTMLTTASGGTTGTSMVLIASATASNSAQIDFTSIDNTAYNAYRIYITNAIPTNNAVNLLLRISNAGTFVSSSYFWQNWRWTTAGSGVVGQGATGTGIALNAAGADNISNASGQGGSWVIDIFNCAQTTAYHRVIYQGHYYGSDQLAITGSGFSTVNTNAIDGFRFLMDSGTIASGTFYLYGIKNA